MHDLITRRPAAAWPAVVAGGLALGFAFPPFPLPFLAWGALVPLLARWDALPDGRRLLQEAYAAFLALVAVAGWWPLAHERPDTALLSLPPLLLLPLLMALPAAVSLPVRRRLGRGAGLAAFAAAFLTLELALSRGPFALPWLFLAHTQADAFPFNQLAAVAGVPGLSLWVLGLNTALFVAWRGRRRRLALAASGVLLLLPLAVPAPPREAPRHLSVGLVQPAVPAMDWADVHDGRRVRVLLALSDSLLAAAAVPPALFVWPETALPVYRTPLRRDSLYGRLQAWVDATGVPLLTGAVTPAPGGAGPDAFYNTALLFRPGGVDAAYHKRLLVPFAERVPGVDRLPWLRALAFPAGGVAGYRPGPPPEPLTVAGADLGVLICFESAFGNYARRYLEKGADLLVTITQDGWWGRSPAYRQHLAVTRLRAIESGRAVVQVAVTGTSALLYADGTAAFETRWHEPTARLADVPLYEGTTPYARWGDAVSYGAVVVLFVLFGAALWTRRNP